MKIKLIPIIILLLTGSLYANPVAGVSGILSNTGRGSSIALLIEQHLIEILKKNNFDTIQAEIINRELTKFNCLEEKCILNFAENADIDLIIRGAVIDKQNSLEVKLEAYGINTPFNKRLINRYEVKIPLNTNLNLALKEFSLIGEEHAAEFISKTLNVFVYPINTKNSKDGFIHYKDKGREISNYYDNRKREIVFEKTSIYDTFFLLAVTPIASASMPAASPLLGYYMNNDWAGLGLWMLNAPPYLYLEARGFINSPKKLKNKNEDISKDDKAINYFAWYMLLIGGMPLFVDSFAQSYLNQASYFNNVSLMGSDVSAGMLSLISNGAGLFYKGERYWGYFYFHLNNILLYMTMRSLSYPEYYNDISNTYDKGSRNKNRAIIYGSILILTKTAEICHAVITKENISSGEVINEYIIPAPLFTLDDKGLPIFGVSVSMKF